MKNQEGTTQVAHNVTRILRLEVIDELLANGEGPSANTYLSFAVLVDRVQSVGKKVFYVCRIAGCADRDDRSARGNLTCSVKDRGASQRVSNQNGGRGNPSTKFFGRGNDVRDICGKGRTHEFPLASSQAREIERQYADPLLDQRGHDLAFNAKVLRTGKTVGKNGSCLWASTGTIISGG
jgi:hypothetical protein